MPSQRTDVGGEHALAPGSLETMERGVEHLEGELEGLQDAVYRQAVLEDEQIDEVRKQLAPEQMARELSRHLEGAGCDRDRRGRRWHHRRAATPRDGHRPTRRCSPSEPAARSRRAWA